MSKLGKKVALVTGGSRGIGAAIAKRLAADGASVAITYAKDTSAASAVVKAIELGGGKAIAIQADSANVEAVKGAVEKAVATFGRLDVLVNNAGVYKFTPLEGVTEDEFHRQFDTNVLGLILATQEAAKYFNGGGSVINVGSVVSRMLPPASVIYSATKGAVDAVTGVLAKELGPKKIRVNSINPGLVITEGTHAAGVAGSDFETQAVALTPLGRAGQPEDIAPVAVFLASDDSYWVTGETLAVSGGR